MKTFKFKVSKYFSGNVKLGEVLKKATNLEFSELADAAAKGAIWLQKSGKGKTLRVRSLHFETRPDDVISFFYDARILSYPELTDAYSLHETPHYGVWFKPAGVLPQGTQASDHTSLLRFVEKQRKKDVFLIHRLDRETAGLMLIGYSSQGAAHLGELFQKNKIKKTYQAIVLGEIEIGKSGTIDRSLDDKEAITHYKVLQSKKGQSLLEVTIDTGRLHQIRRHLDGISHPVIGDPKYGKGNKNREGLKLLAKSLSFEDPWEHKSVHFELEESLTI